MNQYVKQRNLLSIKMAHFASQKARTSLVVHGPAALSILQLFD